MQTIIVDPYEFDSASSEECLTISISNNRARQFDGVDAFAQAAVAIDAAPEQPPFDLATMETIPLSNHQSHRELIHNYLARFAKLTLPEVCHWPTYVLVDESNDCDVVLVAGAQFIRFHWYTTA